MSALKRLDVCINNTVPTVACDAGKNPPKKKRLNLRCRTVGSKNKTIEKELQDALKDTDSSEDTEKPQSISVKNILKSGENLDKGFQNNLRESATKEEDVGNSSLKSCPVCEYEFTSLDSDFSNLDPNAEINEHINKCLDGQSETKTSNPKEHCQLCGKDISKYNTVQCQQHMNRCCDKQEQTQPKPKSEETSFLCPICGKPFKTAKSRQTHMKKCAKEYNVSTHQLIQSNRQDNICNPLVPAVTDNSTSATGQNTVRNNKRKRKANLPAKNLDDDTQLALALSASIRSVTADVRDQGGKRKRPKKKENSSELPALLLRSDDETKKVAEARAAAILCHWVDNDDDEIQCTPALAPSSLVKKCGKESSSHTENSAVLPELSAEVDDEDITERCYSPVIEVRGGSSSKKEEKCDCEKVSESLGTVTTEGEESKCFTVDTESRLWKLSSLRADVITQHGFYVLNLLPKSTPRKKKTTRSTNMITNEEYRVNSCRVDKENKDISEDPPSKILSQNDDLTESQQNDIEMMVELINEDSDTHSTGHEKEQNEEIEKTWFPSSGFCVRKDTHETEEQNKEDLDTLLNDLSCMVGNPLLSDVEIVAKDNKKFCAHSFMLSARCSTLAEILHTSEKCFKGGDSKGLVRLELINIDVRAVRAVVTYLYTAYFIPVVENVIEDVKKLAFRWNLNCNVDQWSVIQDVAGKNHEEHQSDDDDEGNLDVLLKSLWEGEEDIVSGINEEENVFGDSILDDELGNMEIKIYTQATPQKKSCESNQKSAIVLDCDSDCAFSFNDKAIVIGERKTNDVVCSSDDKRRNVVANVLKSEDERLIQSSDDMCITESAPKLSPSCSPEKNDFRECLANDDVALVQQSMGDVVETKTCTSSGLNDANIKTSPARDHSSPVTKESNSDSLNHINSSPILLPSPSSPVEMMSSPERSPLPDNLDDFDMEYEFNSLNKAQIYPVQNTHETSLSNSPNVSEDMSVDSPLSTSVVLTESKITTSAVCGVNLTNNFATADTNKNKAAVLSSRLKRGNCTLVDQTAVMEQSPERNNLSNKNENDSLSDLFATSFECKSEVSPLSNSKCNIDSLSDIDISILSPKSVPVSSSLYTSNSKDKEIGSKENETQLLKAISNQVNKSRNGVETTNGAIFSSKSQYQEMGSNGENTTHKKVNEINETDSWLDASSSSLFKDETNSAQGHRRSHGRKQTSNDERTTKWTTTSVHSKNVQCADVQTDATDYCYDDQIITNRNIETPRRQLYSAANEADSSLCDFPFEIKSTSSPEVPHNAQEDCCNDAFRTDKPRLSLTITDKADCLMDDSSIKSNKPSELEAQSSEENLCDEEQFIDCYDDGGFNCDLDDYFSYDAYSSVQDDSVVLKDEKPGTFRSTTVNTVESNNNKQNVTENPKEEIGKGEVQAQENKNENKSIGVKKGKKKTGGNARKPEKNLAGKQAKNQSNPHLEFKLRDPRTPMLDYSNMATPELKGELRQYGVRPLAKRKMVVKLKEIYNYTHRETHSERVSSDEDNGERKSEKKQQSSEDEEVEPRSEDTNSQEGSTHSSDSEQNCYEEEQPSDESEMLSQQSSLNLSKTLMSFLTQDHELYFKILKFMPISISDVLKTINGNGIQCSAEQLKNFFDEQCITYSEPRPVRVQRKGRRGKNKLKNV
mgnify:CR=1 FL=1